MRLVQYTGPFSRGQGIKPDVAYGKSAVHIGLQVPRRDVISNYATGVIPAMVQIDDQKFTIHSNDVLEFDELDDPTISLTILEALPAESIIDIAYDTSEEI